MRQLSVRFSADIVELLDAAAVSRGVSRSDVVQSWCLSAAQRPGGLFPREMVGAWTVERLRESGRELNFVLAQIHAGEVGYQTLLIDALKVVISCLESTPRNETMTAGTKVRDTRGLSVRVSVAVYPAALDLFDAAAAEAGMTRSGWVRDCVLHGVGMDGYRVPDDSVAELTEVVRRQVSLFVQSEMVGGIEAATLAGRGLDLTETLG